jgi:hypothetical protein
MKIFSRSNFIFAIIAIFLLALSTGCQLYQPQLDDLRTGTAVDEKTKEVTSPAEIFTPNTEAIFASVLVRNATDGTKLRTTWNWAEHPLGEATEIDASGTRFAAFNIQRPREGWRSGTYTVTIEIVGTDQKLQTSFSVE